MARAFILGHGSRDAGGEKTFVPEGKSISFYSEVDQYTLRQNGLAALNAGAIPPVEKVNAKSEVYNYKLWRFEDDALAAYMASESSLTGSKLYFIGLETEWQTTPLPSPLLLCTTPKECAGTKPKHSPDCRGLFALVPEDEILSVNCRGVEGKKGSDTTRLGARTGKVDDNRRDTSEAFSAEITAEAGRLWMQSVDEPDQVMAHLESLTDPTRRMLFAAGVQLKTFAEGYEKKYNKAEPASAVLEARRALEAFGEDSFADRVDAYLFDPDPEDVETIPDADPEGVGAKERLKRKEQRENRKKQREQEKQMVLADPDLKAAYDRSAAKRSKMPSLTEKEDDREAVERQRIMREKHSTLLEARRALQTVGEDSFADHVDKYDSKQKQMVLADDFLRAAYERSAAERTQAALSEDELDPEADPTTDTDDDDALALPTPPSTPAPLTSELSKEEEDAAYRRLAIALKSNQRSDGDKAYF